MPEPQLRRTLEELHEQLETTESVNEDTRELLHGTLRDILDLLEKAGHAEGEEQSSLVERLRETVNEFDASHPQLATLVRRLMDALAQSGI